MFSKKSFFIFILTFHILYYKTSVKPCFSNPIDIFGFDAEDASKARSAVNSSGISSLYYNPGALAFKHSFEMTSGVIFQYAALSAPDTSQHIDDPLYFHAGAAVSPPFKSSLKDRIRIGFLLSTPVNEMARIKIHAPSEVFYPYYDNRSQRTVIIGGASILAIDSPSFGKLGFGASINFFAGLNGGLNTLEGGTRSVETRMSFEFEKIWSLILGMEYEKSNWRFGISYRDSFGINFYTLSFNHVAGTDINMELDALALYSPKTLQYGVKYTSEKFNLSFDIIEELWSFYDAPFVKFNSVMPMVGDLKGNLPDYKFKNSLGLALGAGLNLNSDFTINGGLGFKQKIIEEQTGVTNMLDGDKIILSTGLTWAFSKSVKIKAFLSYQAILGFKSVKKYVVSECGTVPAAEGNILEDEVPCVEDDPSTDGFQTKNPGFPSVTSGGGVFSGGISVEVTK